MLGGELEVLGEKVFLEGSLINEGVVSVSGKNNVTVVDGNGRVESKGKDAKVMIQSARFVCVFLKAKN